MSPTHITKDWIFGSIVPFAEPSWARGSPSPYYKDSHRRLRQAMRNWVEDNIIPYATEWEETRTIPDSIYRLAAESGLLMPIAAGKEIPLEWAGKFPIVGDVKPEEWDGFHDLVLHDELMRVGCIGIPNGLIGGVTLAIPAIQRFGSEELRQRISREVLSGQKRICLAITEPSAGSDVQGITTEAKLSADKKFYIVNGQKKWITSGMYADYFLTLVRTSPSSFALLLVPKGDGITVRHMTMSGSSSAGTAFVDYDDVMVPLGNLVGKEGGGLKQIMSNFNHERLFIGFQSLRCARICMEDSTKYLQSREAFNSKLIDQPIIRFRLAHSAREIEALQAWVESLIFQLGAMSKTDAELFLAGQTAQLKAHSGIVLEKVVGAAVQLMGGIGLTRGGRGERVERIWRDVKGITIPGGSEDVLLEWSIRRALKIQSTLEGNSGASAPKL